MSPILGTAIVITLVGIVVGFALVYTGKKFHVEVDERGLDRVEAVILSMTPAERRDPSLLNSSRKKRIARGSGTQVVDVNRLLKQFEQMQALTKQMSGKNL